jgi:hypothetical protein
VQLKQYYDFDFDHPGVEDILQPHAVQRREVLLKGFTDPVTIAQINPQAAYAENN